MIWVPWKRRLGRALGLIALLCMSAAPIAREHPVAAESPAQAPNPLPASALPAPVELRSTKMDSAIARLAALSFSPEAAQRAAGAASLRLEEGSVQVQVAPSAGATSAARAIASQGGIVTGRLPDGSLLQAWVPLTGLSALAAREEIGMIRAPALAQLADEVDPQALATTSQGVAVSQAAEWHAAGYRGQGVKVGIVDLGFQGYVDAQTAGELPMPVTVMSFVDGQPANLVDATTAHGTACAEIVHDMAPEAVLYLARIATNIDLGEAVTWLISQGVQVISTSLGWYNLTPGDGTGPLAAMVDTARAAGVTWVTAAGNMRRAHWGGPWLDVDGDGLLEFAENLEINYIDLGSGYLLPAGRQIGVYLRWSDWTDVNQDYDLLLMRWNGAIWETIASSTDPQTGHGGQTPTEGVTGITFGIDTNYGYVVKRNSATRPVHLEAYAPAATRTFASVPARSLLNLADAANAITVGAVQVAPPHALEVFSSEGPTNGAGGVAIGGFAKPDLVAYDGVATRAYATFLGTSAAAPHVAGAAALVRCAYPSYSVDQVRALLEARASDMGSPGMDTQYGHGRLLLGQIVARAWLPVLHR